LTLFYQVGNLFWVESFSFVIPFVALDVSAISPDQRPDRAGTVIGVSSNLSNGAARGVTFSPRQGGAGLNIGTVITGQTSINVVGVQRIGATPFNCNVMVTLFMRGPGR